MNTLRAKVLERQEFDWEYILAKKIMKKAARSAIIGLGYVGLPLAVQFATVGYETVGFDIDKERVDCINSGESYIQDVPSAVISTLVSSGRLSATTDFGMLSDIDIVCVCVPTPHDPSTNDPDLSCIRSAVASVARSLHPGMMIILESTTYPGTTEEVVLPLLSSTGLRAGEEFFVVFSPERIDPGNGIFQVHNTPKVVGGVTPSCSNLARALYGQILSEGLVHVVSSPAVAEMTKLLENTFRAVNIALVNEIALLCQRMNLDVWEVIDAASTKPFGFMPFSPGPGVGGHCIPVDPYYLMWRAKQYGFHTRFIELATTVNDSMPGYIVDRLSSLLQDRGKSVEGSDILAIGAAFKRDVSDCRNSPAVKVMEILVDRGARLRYSDPLVPKVVLSGTVIESTDLTESLVADTDCVLVLVDHSRFDWSLIASNAPLIFDTRNALRGYNASSIVRL